MHILHLKSFKTRAEMTSRFENMKIWRKAFALTLSYVLMIFVCFEDTNISPLNKNYNPHEMYILRKDLASG